jgi:hypothetical protein
MWLYQGLLFLFFVTNIFADEKIFVPLEQRLAERMNDEWVRQVAVQQEAFEREQRNQEVIDRFVMDEPVDPEILAAVQRRVNNGTLWDIWLPLIEPEDQPGEVGMLQAQDIQDRVNIIHFLCLHRKSEKLRNLCEVLLAHDLLDYLNQPTLILHYTPVHLCIKYQNFECLSILIEYQAQYTLPFPQEVQNDSDWLKQCKAAIKAGKKASGDRLKEEYQQQKFKGRAEYKTKIKQDYAKRTERIKAKEPLQLDDKVLQWEQQEKKLRKKIKKEAAILRAALDQQIEEFEIEHDLIEFVEPDDYKYYFMSS